MYQWLWISTIYSHVCDEMYISFWKMGCYVCSITIVCNCLVLGSYLCQICEICLQHPVHENMSYINHSKINEGHIWNKHFVYFNTIPYTFYKIYFKILCIMYSKSTKALCKRKRGKIHLNWREMLCTKLIADNWTQRLHACLTDS